MSTYTDEIRKRRTFAIISHPDAGKTTLTEKLLLYGGAINLGKAERYFRHLLGFAVQIQRLLHQYFGHARTRGLL